MRPENPLTKTSEWKALVSTYIRMLKKYQPRAEWCFDMVKDGVEWNDETGRFDKLMTIDSMKELVRRVSPVGPEVPVDDVEDITPSWEWLKQNCKSDGAHSFDYNKYLDWIDAQSDAFYYSRGKEDFFKWEGYEIAAKLGYRKVIFENLS